MGPTWIVVPASPKFLTCVLPSVVYSILTVSFLESKSHAATAAFTIFPLVLVAVKKLPTTIP